MYEVRFSSLFSISVIDAWPHTYYSYKLRYSQVVMSSDTRQ